MTDLVAEVKTVADAGKADAEKAIADTALVAGKLDAEALANVEVAKVRVHSLGHDVAAVGAWLVATTRRLVTDIEHAARLIGSKL